MVQTTGQFVIGDEDALEAVVGKPMDFIRTKIRQRMDEVMMEFVGRSPFILVSTIDANGNVDISPKGDPAGFVRIDDNGNLLIPERPGNQLTFGFRNVLRNGRIGVIFMAPNQRETLRIKGMAKLHNDPGMLESMQVHGKPALLYTVVEVEECFFHCGKALIRSGLWNPKTWNSSESISARHFASLLGGGGEDAVRQTEVRLDRAYKEQLY